MLTPRVSFVVHFYRAYGDLHREYHWRRDCPHLLVEEWQGATVRESLEPPADAADVAYLTRRLLEEPEPYWTVSDAVIRRAKDSVSAPGVGVLLCDICWLHHPGVDQPELVLTDCRCCGCP